MSSSSSYSNSNNNIPHEVVRVYDVFLSFRGEDTRSGFTSYLNDALVREGIKTFFDDDNLVRGKAISTGLMKAIQGSRSSVLILSENYAFSSWCLTELCKIVECMDTSGLIVLPIFYHVKPSHVRKLFGSYRDAFKKHENNPKLDFEEVESWRDALKRVANLAGWTLQETDVEAKFIKDFIAKISSLLDIRKESPHEAARQSRYQDGVYFDHNLVSKMVNPANAPLAIGKLLDDEYPEDFIKDYILPLRSLLPVEQLVKECEKRNHLALLTQFLEQLVSEGSQDVHVHNALGKIIINSNNNPEHFLTTNKHYDSHVLGYYCEKRRDPTLAVVAYRRGQCVNELINVTNRNSLFKLQARYVVERMDGKLWEKVLDPKNEYRKQLIDQVVSTALPESKSPDQISAAIKAFNRFDYCFQGPELAKMALNVQLYEEAFSIYKKINLNVKAVNVLLDNIGSISRAAEFAYQVKEDAVWNRVKLVNPANTPLVVGKLIDDECPENCIKGFILTLHSQLPVEQLVNECEKRNRLSLLTQYLEQLVSEGSPDVYVHNALGKIIINSNNNPEHFLTTNKHYDSHVLGYYCEKRRDPTLAVVAYRRGQCVNELINVTNRNSLFKLQARYVVERMDGKLWEKVLDPKNEYRRQLVDQVVSTALPESKSPDQVSAAIKAFNRFDYCFQGPELAKMAVNLQLYEEAFSIYKKINLNVKAVNVLLDNIGSISRAVEFAYQVKEDAVWNRVKLVNPANTPLVVGKLIDDECPEDCIKGFILKLHSQLPVEQLVNECEKRNRLSLLTQYLEQLVSEGSPDVYVHNALGKIIINSNNKPEHFLTTNKHYDSLVLGNYCEKRRDPTLACVAYRRGQCDKQLINVTNTNSLFKLQARYVVERMDGELWKIVLDYRNEYYRINLIDEVITNALPETNSFDQVSATIKAFWNASLPHKLQMELLEGIVFRNPVFSGNSNFQGLLILTALKEDPSRVMDYVNRLDNFDGRAFGKVTVEAQLYEEAFVIYKKFNLNVEAVNVLLDNIQSVDRAVEFANQVKEDAVWSQVRRRQHVRGSTLKAESATPGESARRGVSLRALKNKFLGGLV